MAPKQKGRERPRGGDLYLATSGYFLLATSGDFDLAIDTCRRAARRRPGSGDLRSVGDGYRGWPRALPIGGDDRQPEAEAFPVTGALGVEALEGLKEPFGGGFGDDWSGVGDREVGVAFPDLGGDSDVTSGHVVAQGVLDEVGDEALNEATVAGGRSGGEVCMEGDYWLVGFVSMMSTVSANEARSNSSRLSRPAWPRMRVSRASMSRSCWAPDASTCWRVTRRDAMSAS